MDEGFRGGNLEDRVFQLLIPSGETEFSEAALTDASGHRWCVVNRGSVPSPDDALDYICVSYSWGRMTVPNPFDPLRPMSHRVQSIFETASAVVQHGAIWLDAACMPTHEPARRLCLQSMGAIYASAREVLVVLSPSTFNLLEKVRRGEALSPGELLQLEADDWIGRAWTYQEMVNSKSITFVAEGRIDACVGGEKLLNAIGHAFAQYRKAQEVDAYEFRKQHAQLDALETLIEDWLMAELTKRSAYRIMAAMESRTAVYPDDYLYATVGAITTTLPDGRSDAALSPPEFFMRVCERKQDFSFIYSTALRDRDNAGAWRPKPERLHPIVPWPITGDRQSGDLREGSLHLHSMARLARGPLDEAARIFVHDWLRKTVRSQLPSDIGDAAHETLCRAGFAGCGQYVDTTCGLFFPQHSIGNAGRTVIFVAKGIFFNFGAPGLLVAPVAEGKFRFLDVGVFVGPIPENGESLVIA